MSAPNIQWMPLATSQGLIALLFDLQIEGTTLHLKDLSIYAAQEDPVRGILGDLLRSRKEIAEFAKLAGCDKLRITGYRTPQSSSANPGKIIDFTVNLPQ